MSWACQLYLARQVSVLPSAFVLTVRLHTRIFPRFSCALAFMLIFVDKASFSACMPVIWALSKANKFKNLKVSPFCFNCLRINVDAYLRKCFAPILFIRVNSAWDNFSVSKLQDFLTGERFLVLSWPNILCNQLKNLLVFHSRLRFEMLCSKI